MTYPSPIFNSFDRKRSGELLSYILKQSIDPRRFWNHRALWGMEFNVSILKVPKSAQFTEVHRLGWVIG